MTRSRSPWPRAALAALIAGAFAAPLPAADSIPAEQKEAILKAVKFPVQLGGGIRTIALPYGRTNPVALKARLI